MVVKDLHCLFRALSYLFDEADAVAKTVACRQSLFLAGIEKGRDSRVFL